MPFTRVSLRVGRPTKDLKKIADSLDAALVDSFDVPKNDRFVVIHQHQAEELIFDRQYGGSQRSDDFILFHITTGKARSDAVKRAFYQRLVSNLAKAPGIKPEDVMVVIANSTIEDWSFSAGHSAADMSKEAII